MAARSPFWQQAVAATAALLAEAFLGLAASQRSFLPLAWCSLFLGGVPATRRDELVPSQKSHLGGRGHPEKLHLLPLECNRDPCPLPPARFAGDTVSWKPRREAGSPPAGCVHCSWVLCSCQAQPAEAAGAFLLCSPCRCSRSEAAAAPGAPRPRSCTTSAWCGPTSWRPSRTRTISSAA